MKALLVVALLPAMLTTAEVPLIAHRGASADAPENTLPAFEEAWRQGADGIELDVHLTADGQAICLHDAHTKKHGDRALVAAQSTLAALQQVDVGAWKDPRFAGTPPPALSEVLATVPSGKQVFIEIKSGPETVPAVVQAVAEAGLSDAQVRVISFKTEVIQAVEAVRPNWATGWLTGVKHRDGVAAPSATEIAERVAACGADAVGLDARQGDAAWFASLQEAGVEVHAWTINDPARARELIGWGVKSLTTDRPGAMREGLEGYVPADR